MKSIARVLHLLSCDKKHIETQLPYVDLINKGDSCFWYLEEQMDTCWEEPDHKKWLEGAEVFLKFFGDNEEKAHRALTSLTNICARISFLTKDCDDDIRSIIVKIIEKSLQI